MTYLTESREAVRVPLADHFIMWRDLDVGGLRGGWFCECGEKFGFSDSAIDHQVEALIASGAVVPASAVEAAASWIGERAGEEWDAHNEAADMGDIDAANVHGAVGEVLDEARSRLLAALTERSQR